MKVPKKVQTAVMMAAKHNYEARRHEKVIEGIPAHFIPAAPGSTAGGII